MSNVATSFVRFLLSLTSLLLVLASPGCGASGAHNGSPTPAAASTEHPKPARISPDIISTGDRISIVFADIPNPFTHEERVRQDGQINLPIVGKSVTAAGKTAGMLQEEIHKYFVPDYFKRMTVTVKTDARFFTVSGQVRAPSLVPYITDMTVLRAIAAAGDFTDFADKRSVELTRVNREKFIIDCIKAQRDSKLDMPVYPGDQINVPRRLF